MPCVKRTIRARRNVAWELDWNRFRGWIAFLVEKLISTWCCTESEPAQTNSKVIIGTGQRRQDPPRISSRGLSVVDFCKQAHVDTMG